MIDPKNLGLTSRDKIEVIEENHLALVIHRKSRIIMADGKRFLEKIQLIQKNMPKVKVSLKTSTPMCSKTRSFLEAHGVRILNLEK